MQSKGPWEELGTNQKNQFKTRLLTLRSENITQTKLCFDMWHSKHCLGLKAAIPLISCNKQKPYGPYCWVNYNDLTATSLGSWLIRGSIPKWPYFRFVNYYNLPRILIVVLCLDLWKLESHGLLWPGLCALVQVMPPPSVESAPRTFVTCDVASLTSLEEVAPGVTSRWKSAKKNCADGKQKKG